MAAMEDTAALKVSLSGQNRFEKLLQRLH